MIFALARRNLWRQPRRTILSTLAIALTTTLMVFMLSFQFGGYLGMIESSMALFDGHLQIQVKGYKKDPSIRKTIDNPNNLLSKIIQNPTVKHAGGRANGFGLLSSPTRSFGAMIIGVQPEHEPGLSTVPKKIVEGRFFSQGADNEIILGQRLAQNLGLKVGDAVTLLGTGLNGSMAVDSLQIIGLFKSGIPEIDRRFAEMPLTRFQETFSIPDQAHSIVLSGASAIALQEEKENILALLDSDSNLVVLDWTELQPPILQAILLDMSSALLIYVVLIIVVTFSLLNSLLMSVLERTREFGMLMALGMKPAILGKVVWVETLMLILFGVLTGLLFGYAISEYYHQTGIYFEAMEEMMAEFGMSGSIYPIIHPFTLFAGPLFISLSIALAGLYPILRIRRLEPVMAMRKI
jgi:ABC-type lipoprotein release transport system permease subunit